MSHSLSERLLTLMVMLQPLLYPQYTHFHFSRAEFVVINICKTFH